MFRFFYTCCTAILLFYSCNNHEKKTKIKIQAIKPKQFYTFQNNHVTEKGFLLGKKLFYDPILSADSTISCGSCHKQENAFADKGERFSTGIHGRLSKRNTPGLFNLAWNTSFMWDGGVNHLEIQPLAPITNHLEMDENLAHVLEKVNRSKHYKSNFLVVFGTDSITSQLLFRVLAQFTGSMVSQSSNYDKVMENKMQFSETEENGYNLFVQHCSSCHREPLFTDFSFKDNGLRVDPTHVDSGRYLITIRNADLYKFKIPSLRNVELTAPYMHDGRFSTLEQVIDHYASNPKNGSGDNVLNQKVHLNQKEKKELVVFLKTLTDNEFISDKRFKQLP